MFKGQITAIASIKIRIKEEITNSTLLFIKDQIQIPIFIKNSMKANRNKWGKILKQRKAGGIAFTDIGKIQEVVREVNLKIETN